MKQLIYIVIGFYAISNYAQTASVDARFKLPTVMMLDLEPSGETVTLNLVAPNEAGEKADFVMANNKKWINFSSAVTSAGTPRSISIQIDVEGGQVPPGVYLKLITSKYKGIGNGKLGSLVGDGVVTLSNIAQVIISKIEGAYTGNGVNNGYELTYYLEIYDYKSLDFDQSTTLSITLTLSEI